MQLTPRRQEAKAKKIAISFCSSIKPVQGKHVHKIIFIKDHSNENNTGNKFQNYQINIT